ncbi:hypothetical protein DPMN_050310 [Dreissena polymorpha]|uniref:Uncharacterized protein n=1 Tax=Dreissena polymorpha TaxID=45954 RepID=A0A9D4CH93_DREPO|nr:hypothetical protein DPMN_050310 [Dreissena polymorpha]
MDSSPSTSSHSTIKMVAKLPASGQLQFRTISSLLRCGLTLTAEIYLMVDCGSTF